MRIEYGEIVSLHIQSECGKIRTRITPNTDNFHAVDANLSGESMAMKSLRTINTKLQFLYIQNELVNPKLRSLLCNFLIQPHFDYACISWYTLISQKMRKKLQVTQNEFIHFCLKLNSRQHIRAK